MRARELHHVAIVVKDIDAALGLWRDLLGMEVSEVRDVPNDRVRIAFLPAGETLLELVQPLDDTSGVARYLARRGESALHHVCFAVDDLAGALGELAGAGVELLDRAPRQGAEGEVAFLHPRSGKGVLIELIERGR